MEETWATALNCPKVVNLTVGALKTTNDGRSGQCVKPRCRASFTPGICGISLFFKFSSLTPEKGRRPGEKGGQRRKSVEVGVGFRSGVQEQQRTAHSFDNACPAQTPGHPCTLPPPESRDLCSLSVTGGGLLSGSTRLWPKPRQRREHRGNDSGDGEGGKTGRDR